MKRMHQLYALSYSLLLTGAACAADMGTPTPVLPSTQVNATPSWNAEQKELGNILIDAVGERSEKDVAAILAFDASLVNFQSCWGATALMRAAEKGDARMVERLLSAKAEVNLKDKCGITALIEAINEGSTEIVKRLLVVGAQVNAQDNNGDTALTTAASRGHTEIIQTLLDASADLTLKNNKEKTAQEIALERGYLSIAELLQEPEEETLMVKPAVD